MPHIINYNLIYKCTINKVNFNIGVKKAVRMNRMTGWTLFYILF